ncbi:MAG: amidase [Paracoccaceae bacterium]
MSETDISTSDIQAAERLTGIAYTPEERAQMVTTIEAQILQAQARRAMPLDNSVPMASRFDPRLPGFVMPTKQGVSVRADDVPLPDNDTDIAFATLPQLAAWIASGALTSCRLTRIYLDRIDRLNPHLLCYATVTADLAMSEAKAMDARLGNGDHLGPLHGIPYGLKDLFDTKGIATGWGAEPYRDRVPQTDARIVTLLREAGAVLLGKTTLGALAYGDVWYGGQTRNPFNLDEGSSGSSAGSAAATAAGLCAFAIGTETLGSITSPSQRCGTTGLRPTFGRVSRAGAMALCWSLDKVGPICRGVDDTALVLDAINGPDPNDLGSISARFSYDKEQDISGLKIGYLPAAFDDGADDIDRAALTAICQLGCDVVEVSLPDLPYASLMNILFAESAAAFEDLTLTNQDDSLARQDGDAWPNKFRQARFLSAVDHVQLDRLRYQVMQALDDLFQGIDVLVGPFSTGPMLIASNFTGHPCLHLRAGFADASTRDLGGLHTSRINAPTEEQIDQTHTVPSGISLWGRLFDEGTILRVGRALEARLDVASIRPDSAT